MDKNVDKKPASWGKQAGVTPGKLILIGVLAVMLASVLYIQYGPQGETAPVAVAVNQPAVPAAAATNAAPAAAEQVAAPIGERKKTGAVAHWHAPDLQRVVAYDPFALPAAFPKPPTPEETALAQSTAAASSQDAAQRVAELEAARAKTESELSGLKQQAVKVMITRNDEFVAIVGDQVVHVGDELDGFKVIAIDSDGVHVAKDLTQ